MFNPTFFEALARADRSPSTLKIFFKLIARVDLSLPHCLDGELMSEALGEAPFAIKMAVRELRAAHLLVQDGSVLKSAVGERAKMVVLLKIPRKFWLTLDQAGEMEERRVASEMREKMVPAGPAGRVGLPSTEV